MHAKSQLLGWKINDATGDLMSAMANSHGFIAEKPAMAGSPNSATVQDFQGAVWLFLYVYLSSIPQFSSSGW